MSKTKWALDPTHSEVGFKVKHMMITNVSGSFGQFDASAETDSEDFGTAAIQFTAQIASVDTNNEQRDGHLKSPDFFDAAQYPTLSFVSSKVEKKSGDVLAIHGNLTVKGISKPVVFEAEQGGIGKDPWGNVKAGFTVSGKLNRSDFGLSWNAALETGGVLVSEEVKLHAELQFVKQG